MPDYRTQSALFTIGPLPEDNLLGATPDTTTQSVSDGFFVLLAPLSEGKHKIHFGVEAAFTLAEDGFDFILSMDVTYNLKVVDKGHR